MVRRAPQTCQKSKPTTTRTGLVVACQTWSPLLWDHQSSSPAVWLGVYGAGKAGWSAKANGGGWDVCVCTRHVTYWPLEVQCPLGNVLLARTVACNSVGKVVLLQGSLLALLELLHASCQQQAVTANSISIALHLCKPSLDTATLTRFRRFTCESAADAMVSLTTKTAYYSCFSTSKMKQSKRPALHTTTRQMQTVKANEGTVGEGWVGCVDVMVVRVV